MTLREHLSPDQRPRERLLQHGANSLTNAELLALILGTGTRGLNALKLAEQLLVRFGGLRPLLSADSENLRTVVGLGNARICQLNAIQTLARRAMEEELKRECSLQHPTQVKAYCANLLGHASIERCVALFLDNQHRLISTKEISQGTLTEATIYPRELVKAGLAQHAAAVILAHNHPSGVAKPSRADILLTQRLRQSLAVVDIELLDHLVVAGHQVISIAELGHM
ncbi:RadC family protein [Zwartia vadi]|uniref:RadC family protein n=1 Tax=Zwartia vadi TaxID=3058168 RepID=UPI0025B5DA9F|nr:DNA repair protein RadC [Zwartia vadi]MDN3987173.1 DNA repair protein RadC [Zwartia vadi]